MIRSLALLALLLFDLLLLASDYSSSILEDSPALTLFLVTLIVLAEVGASLII